MGAEVGVYPASQSEAAGWRAWPACRPLRVVAGCGLVWTRPLRRGSDAKCMISENV